MNKSNRLKAVLAEQDKTYKWLLKQIDKSACMVSKLCNNTAPLDINTLDNIARLIDVKELLNLKIVSKSKSSNQREIDLRLTL